MFVTNLNSDGSSLLYSSYLDGSSTDVADQGNPIAVDSSGNAYLTGFTTATDFPTHNPYQPNNAGAADAFVTVVNAAGSGYIYSTYLGGSGNDDQGRAVAVDGSGHAYVVGVTNSTNFPTHNPIQPSNAGGDHDAFVTEFPPTGTALVYSTYLGGSAMRAATRLRLMVVAMPTLLARPSPPTSPLTTRFRRAMVVAPSSATASSPPSTRRGRRISTPHTWAAAVMMRVAASPLPALVMFM